MEEDKMKKYRIFLTIIILLSSQSLKVYGEDILKGYLSDLNDSGNEEIIYIGENLLL